MLCSMLAPEVDDLADLLDCIAGAVRRELAGPRQAGRSGCTRPRARRAEFP